MTFDGADNTLALADHDDHIHVGFRPLYGAEPQGSASRLDAVLKPEPVDQADRPPRRRSTTRPCRPQPSKYAIRASDAQARQRPPTRASRPGRDHRAGPPLPLRPARVPVGARPAGRPLRAARPRRRARARARLVRRSARPQRRLPAAAAAARPARPSRPRAVPTARATLVARRRRSATRATRPGWLGPTTPAEADDGPSTCSTAVLHAQRIGRRRPVRARGRARPGARGPRRLRRRARRSPTAAGRGARAARAAQAGRTRVAPPPCARRSGSRRCSAAATSRWPPRSSRCARGSTSTRAARREAALQLRVALEAAHGGARAVARRTTSPTRLAELREGPRRGRRRRNAALQGGIDDATAEEIDRVLARLEAALRARVAQQHE